MTIRQSIAVGVLLLAACQPQQEHVPAKVDFAHVHWFAERAAIAYQTPEAIRQAFPNTILVATTDSSKVLYFLELDQVHKLQIVTIRGTDNLRNIVEDADYIVSQNPKLGIYVHRGFDQDASQIFNALLPHLDKAQPVVVTGHSLGAAIATLLMMYLQEEGFQLQPSINFGQPKVTNQAGVEKYHSLPLLRVVDEDDLVPLLPPTDLVDSIHGAYQHLGPQLVLLKGSSYRYQNHREIVATAVDSFWKNIGNESLTAHYMKNYLKNIVSKLKLGRAVSGDSNQP